MSEKRKIAEEIYMALHGQQYFMQVRGLVDDEIEEFKANVIADIEAEIPDVDAIREAGREDERVQMKNLTKDPYILGLHESEVRQVITRDYAYFQDSDKLDEFITQLGEFDYDSLWDDVTDFAEAFIRDEKNKDV